MRIIGPLIVDAGIHTNQNTWRIPSLNFFLALSWLDGWVCIIGPVVDAGIHTYLRKHMVNSISEWLTCRELTGGMSVYWWTSCWHWNTYLLTKTPGEFHLWMVDLPWVDWRDECALLGLLLTLEYIPNNQNTWRIPSLNGWLALSWLEGWVCIIGPVVDAGIHTY